MVNAVSSRPGSWRLSDPEPVEMLRPDELITQGEHGRHLHLNVRPEAPVRILLTGHMDTVFAVDHPFQMLEWLEEGMLNGPGVADMKGGLALRLAALTAFETSPLASHLGYGVVINSDEAVGSPSSARLNEQAEQR